MYKDKKRFYAEKGAKRYKYLDLRNKLIVVLSFLAGLISIIASLVKLFGLIAICFKFSGISESYAQQNEMVQTAVEASANSGNPLFSSIVLGVIGIAFLWSLGISFPFIAIMKIRSQLQVTSQKFFLVSL